MQAFNQEPTLVFRPLSEEEQSRQAAVHNFVDMMEDRGAEDHEDLVSYAQAACDLTRQQNGDYGNLVFNTGCVIDSMLQAGATITKFDGAIVHEVARRIYLMDRYN